MASLMIETSSSVNNSTWCRVEDAEPTLEGATLTIYTGYGTRRSWGTPGTTSTVVLHEEDLVVVHVGYHNKYHGGQFWRYYRPTADVWQQVVWAQLSDDERQRVLDAAKKAPAWAKTPGKLRTQRQPSSAATRTTYKIVERMWDGTLRSVYDGETRYELGVRIAQKAEPNHGGGFYSYPSAERVKRLFWERTLFPAECYREERALALLECEISGTMLDYDGKLASTYLRPMRIVESFDYNPERMAVSA